MKDWQTTFAVDAQPPALSQWNNKPTSKQCACTIAIPDYVKCTYYVLKSVLNKYTVRISMICSF